MRTLMMLLLCLLPLTLMAQINEKAIVLLNVTKISNNPTRPWAPGAPADYAGTGFVIEGNRIITNAHNVSSCTYITVTKGGDTKKYEATPVYVSHQADLALLEVKDEAFFSDIEPLTIGTRPKNQEQITVVGYPKGGEELSYTSGIVSRIEVNSYTHSFEYLLTIQVDAALNPGNSGGPAFLEDKVVGIAMMGDPSGDGLGYLIPTDVIQHFLTDIKDGVLHGIPRLGVTILTLENRMLRRSLGLAEDDDKGIMVAQINRMSDSPSLIHYGDIIMEIDGVPVRANGKVIQEDGLLVAHNHLISSKQVGENIALSIIRDGQPMSLDVVAERNSELVQYERFGIDYPYFLFGGFLFTPLYFDYIRDDAGDSWPHARQFHLIANEPRTAEREEVVILHTIFKHQLTSEMPGRKEPVKKVNGVNVRNFRHFIELIENAAGWIEITFDAGYRIKLDVRACIGAEEEIMKTYRIEKKKVL